MKNGNERGTLDPKPLEWLRNVSLRHKCCYMAENKAVRNTPNFSALTRGRKVCRKSWGIQADCCWKAGVELCWRTLWSNQQEFTVPTKYLNSSTQSGAPVCCLSVCISIGRAGHCQSSINMSEQIWNVQNLILKTISSETRDQTMLHKKKCDDHWHQFKVISSKTQQNIKRAINITAISIAIQWYKTHHPN